MKNSNYLENIPIKNDSIHWTKDSDGLVTLEIENTGILNRVVQKLFKKPKVSYIHLDKTGSFVWQVLDGGSDIIKIGEAVREHFGEEAEPLYERLAKYFQILNSYGFISWK